MLGNATIVDMPKFICRTCKKETYKKSSKAVYCSNECFGIDKIRVYYHKCSWCKVEFSTHEKRRGGKSGLAFCCRNCKDQAATYCPQGIPELWAPHFGNRDLKTSKDFSSRDKFRTEVACHARTVYKRFNKTEECYICGYALLTDVAHIKPVADFPEESSFLEINDPDNLVRLCRNHHGELDILGLFCLIKPPSVNPDLKIKFDRSSSSRLE